MKSVPSVVQAIQDIHSIIDHNIPQQGFWDFVKKTLVVDFTIHCVVVTQHQELIPAMHLLQQC